MSNMTSKERVDGILKLQPVDRIGISESFWGDALGEWRKQGQIGEDESLDDHFGLDIIKAGWPNYMADLDFEEQIVEETDEWKLVRNGNGALLKWWKSKSGTPEHVDFEVKDRTAWEEKVKPLLQDDSRLRDRIPFKGYREARQKAAEENKYFCWTGINVFEQMHPVCGHEYMLMGMALDPDWVRDMCEVFTDLTLKIQQTLFAEEGQPDGFWYYEDMGFKGKPFMSPAMYKDIIWPSHKRSFDYAHSIDCSVIVHSCGYVEPLVPGLIEAGMNCLQAIEAKAGMDLLKLKNDFGDRIAFCGGLDIRVLESNDQAAVDTMLETMLPPAMASSGYILHTDHSVSPRVNYETYKHFVDKGLAIGTYG